MKKYCIVGTGNRGIGMYGLALVEKYREVAEITGLCDNNSGRLNYARKKLGESIPVFTDFDEMLEKVECDTVIVCSKDCTHHEYIVKALRGGKDVITEKPMTVDDVKCREILEAERETGRKVQVTFNYRFVPYVVRIKELLDSGMIGKIQSVDFHWYLDTVHGADYYRRWHRRKENSGGLQIHKSTHHFDIVNWWVGQDPQQVFAYGSRNFYGDKGAIRGERCLTCRNSSACPFYMDISKSVGLKELYLDNEKFDGYFRDRCVFDPEINIEDTMSVLVKYTGGAQLTYSLVSYAPVEGWQLTVSGSKGRLEAFHGDAFVPTETPNYAQRETNEYRKSIDWRFAQGDGADEALTKEMIKVFPLFGGVQTFTVDKSAGEHGGGDDRLRDMLFLPGQTDDMGIMAGTHAGAMSILIGTAANYSMTNNCPIAIKDLMEGTLPRDIKLSK